MKYDTDTSMVSDCWPPKLGWTTDALYFCLYFGRKHIGIAAIPGFSPYLERPPWSVSSSQYNDMMVVLCEYCCLCVHAHAVTVITAGRESVPLHSRRESRETAPSAHVYIHPHARCCLTQDVVVTQACLCQRSPACESPSPQ